MTLEPFGSASPICCLSRLGAQLTAAVPYPYPWEHGMAPKEEVDHSGGQSPKPSCRRQCVPLKGLGFASEIALSRRGFGNRREPDHAGHFDENGQTGS